MAQPRYRIGTRGSKLALAQTQQVIDLLRSFDPEAEFPVEIIATASNYEGAIPRAESTGPAAFTAELEQALLEDKIDIAVHSAKDLPVEAAPGLTIAAYTARLDPREALICQHGEALMDLPPGGIVGVSSLRRQFQLSFLRPDLNFVALRGNLDVRLRKVRHGEYQSTVVERAGLIRLGLASAAAQILPLDLILPAAGQGALALQCRHDDMHCFQLLELANHEPTAWGVLAERTVLRQLKGNPSWAVGVSASFPYGQSEKTGRRMLVQAVAFDPGTGKRSKGRASGRVAEWHDLAMRVADQLDSRTSDRTADQPAQERTMNSRERSEPG